jgi:hypothetical protein
MRKSLALLFSGIFIATSLVALSSTPASAAVTLTTCTDLGSKASSALKATQKSCKPLLAPALWHLQQSDSPAHLGTSYATIRICSSQNPVFTYQYIKKSCPKFQVTTDYWRTITEPSIPIIASSSAIGYDGAVFTLSTTVLTTDAPIAYYLVTNIKTGDITKISLLSNSQLSLAGLNPLTSYTFTIAAVSVDGTSRSSAITQEIRTEAVPVAEPAPAVTSAPALTAPAFTLTSIAETKTVNTKAIGFTISSTGGTIASFAISATPAGMSFSTSTGALSGTPTSVAAATTYTITATNATGSATRIFMLTVPAAIIYTVGQTGPAGGTVFYVAITPFACGPTRATTCTYLEAPPALWNVGVAEPVRSWAQSTPVDYEFTVVGSSGSPETATATAIGWGYRNTRAIILQGNSNSATSAAALADSFTVTVSSVVYDDWYLPSKDELNQLYLQKTTIGDLEDGYYWSSSESPGNDPWRQIFDDGLQDVSGKDEPNFVRPVRAF